MKIPSKRPKGNCWKKPGLIAKSWTKILTMHLSNSVTDELAVIYLARDLEQAESIS